MLLLDADALLRLDRLVQALAPAAALHDPAGELVDDLHLVVLDDVVDVAVVQRLRLQRLREMVDHLRVARVVQILHPQRALDLLDALLGHGDGLVLLVELVVRARVLGGALRVAGMRLERDQRRRDAREVVVELRGGLRLAGDDQRRARLVDQDGVDLVHDGEVVAALDDPLELHGHVVAQVVEAELRVRPVRDVALIRLAARLERHHVLDVGGAHAERLEHRARPLAVALGQVVVGRDEVRALTGDRVEIQRLRGDERLALAGLHLGDVALVQHDPAHQLDIEETHVHRSLERLADGGERLEQELVERLAVREPFPELDRLRGELLVRQGLVLGLERADVRRLLGEALEPPALADAEDLLEGAELLDHGGRVAVRARTLGPPRGRRRAGPREPCTPVPRGLPAPPGPGRSRTCGRRRCSAWCRRRCG